MYVPVYLLQTCNKCLQLCYLHNYVFQLFYIQLSVHNAGLKMHSIKKQLTCINTPLNHPMTVVIRYRNKKSKLYVAIQHQ